MRAVSSTVGHMVFDKWKTILNNRGDYYLEGEEING
jgi:hypothetical protein